MKKTLIAALLSLTTLSGLAYADNTVGKTREQVIQEVAQARASGELDRLAQDYNYPDVSKNFVSTKTRAQVEKEVADARKSGELDRLAQDYSYPDVDAHFVSTKTREQVKQELIQAENSGEFAKMQQLYRN